MDDAKAADLVKTLVAHHVTLVPTFIINYRGYPKEWAQFRTEAHEWYKDPNLQKYYPKVAMEESLRQYETVDAGAVRERRLKGWENVKRFHKMFVDAGGHLCISGNLNDRYVPGLELFQEMRIMTEVGMTPMQIRTRSAGRRRPSVVSTPFTRPPAPRIRIIPVPSATSAPQPICASVKNRDTGSETTRPMG